MKDPFNGVKYTFLMALYVSLKYLITKRFTSQVGKFYTKIKSNNAVFLVAAICHLTKTQAWDGK